MNLRFVLKRNIIRYLSQLYFDYYFIITFGKHFYNKNVKKVDVYTSKIINLVRCFD